MDGLNDNLAAGSVSGAQASVRSALAAVTRSRSSSPPARSRRLPPSTPRRCVAQGARERGLRAEPPGGKFDVDGELYDKLKMTVILDGYGARDGGQLCGPGEPGLLRSSNPTPYP